MKTINFFIILIISLSTLKSQDVEPTQRLFNYIGSSQYLNAENASFKQNNFLLGWHWCSGKSMTKALSMNQGHISIGEGITQDTSDLASNLKLLVNIPLLSSWYGFSPLNGPSLKYEPTLQITNPGSYAIRANDSSNAIFGFKNIKGFRDTNTLSENYNRLILNRTVVDSGDIVLSEPWMSNQFRYDVNLKDNNKNSFSDSSKNLFAYFKDQNCFEMYFTINLRRFYTSGSQNSTKVLGIKLPYITEYDSVYFVGDTLKVASGGKRHTRGNIYFSYVPVDNNTSNTSINGRGKFQDTVSIAPDSVFYITRNMLPNGSDRDITISAKFICDNIALFPGRKNPHFKPGSGDKNDRLIDSLKIEVVYLDTTAIAIDWIKIESKLSQDLHRGFYDTLMYNSVQATLDTFSLTKFTAKGIILGRIYTIDEIGDPPFWAGFRYINKYMGNIFTNESNPPYPDLFNYYVNPPDYIHSLALGNPFYTPGPFFPNGRNHFPLNYNDIGVMGRKWGYNLFGDANILNSDYETFFVAKPSSSKWLRDTASMEDYINILGQTDSYQWTLERTIYDLYMPKQGNFLYQNKNWNTWGYVCSNWGFIYHRDTLHSAIDTFAVGGRPFTGEEMSGWMWNAISMGSKGFLYDREYTGVPLFTPGVDSLNPNGVAGGWTPIGIGHNQKYYNDYNLNRLDDMSFVYSDSVGSDFMELNNDFSNFDRMVDTHFARDSMKVMPNRIYLGRKSARSTIKRIHNYIRANENFIMKLKLQGAMSKGFKLFKTHHPNLDSNIQAYSIFL